MARQQKLTTAQGPSSLIKSARDKRATSNPVLGVYVPNPRLHQFVELLGLVHKVPGFGFSCYVCRVVINLVSFAAARIEVGDKRRHLGAHRELKRLEGRLMVAESDNPVSRTGDDHLSELEHGIVRRSEAAVSREAGYLGILQVSFNDVAQVVKFGGACPVWPNLLSGQ